jgi:hypothetical protein
LIKLELESTFHPEAEARLRIAAWYYEVRQAGRGDREALEWRREHEPANSAVDMAAAMGIELLKEAQYRNLQTLGGADTKTSSWVQRKRLGITRPPCACRQPLCFAPDSERTRHEGGQA